MEKEKANIQYIGKCLLINEGGARVLVIGDLHLGFEESLNQSGVLVTRIMLDETLKELERVFTRINAYDFVGRGASVSAEAGGNRNASEGNQGLYEAGKRASGGLVLDKIVLLGDVKHYFGRILRQEWTDVLKLLEYLKTKCNEVVIIKGNHDIMLKPIAKKLGLNVKDYWIFKKEFCFLHGDEDFARAHDKNVKYWIIGHGHPAVALRSGPRTERYKCFLSGRFEGKTVVMLPSFSEWYVGSDPREGVVITPWKFDFGKFNVKVVGDNLKVLDFGKLKSLE